MSGKLLDFPPCDIYGIDGKGMPIRIGFNEVAIQRIDGKRFRQDWTLNLSCDNTTGSGMSIELIYKGEPSQFDEYALVTDKPALGIRLYQKSNDQIVRLNMPVTLAVSSSGYQQIPLYSVPTKDTNAKLSAGKFTASATLALNYP
ncbi:TPA: fimbrial protein [Providencia stuartii]|nr:fimbrial protein [Providencia stuartii]